MKKAFVLFFYLTTSTTTFCMLGCSKNDLKGSDENSTNPQNNNIRKKEDITSLGKLTVSLENKNGSESAEGSLKATDGNTTSKFLIYDFAGGFYMQLQFDKPQAVAAYALTSGNDADGRDPRDWTITASNDGSNWKILDAQHYELFDQRNETKKYNFKNKETYKYYRLTINANRGDQMFQLSEWRLWVVPLSEQVVNPITRIDTLRKNNLTLYFVTKFPDFSTDLKQKLIDVFFVNYPKLLKDFNVNATKTVVFSIDPEYSGVAMTSGGVVTYSSTYMSEHPKDIDVVTHEIMHIIQSYRGGSGPSWLTEGIADYVRYKYGIDNAGAGWSMPAYNSNQSYENSYRITARFLAWLELHVKNGIVKNLDAMLRTNTYSEKSWEKETSKTVDELWNMYSLNPDM